MSERTGKIVAYFPANRQGKIQPDDKGPAALFYVTSVTNADPAPKRNDLVTFSAPEPRKNKNGKLVQDQASSVTISTRAPEPTKKDLAQLARKENPARRSRKGSNRKDKNNRRQSSSTRTNERSSPSSENRKTSKESKPWQKDSKRSGPASRNRGRNTQRPKASVRSKVRYPTAKDVGKNVFHIEFSNPSLVSKKFVQWPTPLDPKADASIWRLSEKNQNFFLTRTLAPLYRNFEKKTLPWAAVRARRESLLRTMEQSGFHVASEIVRGPWRYGIEGLEDQILKTANISFDYTYGFPIIPAYALQRVLVEALELNPDIAQPLKDAVAGKPGELNCCILDAVPRGRIQQFTIERCDVVSAKAVLKDEKPPILCGNSHAMCLGDDAGFVISIALSASTSSRADAQKLVSALGACLSSINSAAVLDGQKEPAKAPQAVLF